VVTHAHQQPISPTRPWQHQFQLLVLNSSLPLPLLSSTQNNQLLHVLLNDNKNILFHFAEIYYFGYNCVGYTNCFDSSNHCFTNFDHLVFIYIVDFEIDYLVYYIPIIVSFVVQLALLLLPHTLEQFPSKDIFQPLLC
jgi:hypothetical protein